MENTKKADWKAKKAAYMRLWRANQREKKLGSKNNLDRTNDVLGEIQPIDRYASIFTFVYDFNPICIVYFT